jgi:uncharacterized protein YraI
MNRSHLLLIGIGFGLVLPAASSAEMAYTTKSVSLRAGPSREFPRVARIPAGVPVEVNGCVEDWTWCDVTLGFDRGWVYAGNLEYPYQDRRVVILDNGPSIGFPIVTFSVGPYWDTYYRGRPWYSRRSYWSHRSPHHWVRPSAPRPPGYRPQPARPSRPVVVRPPVVVQPRPQPVRPHVVRPEVARPQVVRPAPARPPENRPRPERREDRKPRGN